MSCRGAYYLPYNEITVLIAYAYITLEACMRNYLFGLESYYLVWHFINFHTPCMLANIFFWQDYDYAQNCLNLHKVPILVQVLFFMTMSSTHL